MRTFNQLERFSRDFDSLVSRPRTRRAAAWLPNVDIAESEGHYILRADLPGLSQEAIDVNLNEDVLSISGKRERNDSEETTRVASERHFGAFVRKFSLGPNVNPEGIEAEYKDGVLTLTLPKAERAKSRSIPVSMH